MDFRAGEGTKRRRRRREMALEDVMQIGGGFISSFEDVYFEL